MFFTLQEAQNRPAGASVPALGLYNKAISSLLDRNPRTDQQELVSPFRTVQYSYMFFTLQEGQNRPAGANIPALGLSNKAIYSLLYRKPRTDQKELVFLL